MSLADLVSPDPITVSPDTELREAVALMDRHDVRHLPVVEQGVLVGMISDRDLLAATGWNPSRLVRLREAPPGLVRDLALRPPLVAGLDEDPRALARRMLEHRIHALPVLEDGRLVGIVSEYDYLVDYVRSCRGVGSAPRVDRPVSECMTWNVETAQRRATIADVFSQMHRLDVLHLPVLDGERLMGILSDRDFRLHIGRGISTHLPVSAICARDPITIGSEALLSEATELLLLHKIGALPVLRGTALIGLLSSTDVLSVCANAHV